MTNERIILGSGDLYLVAYDSETGVPAKETIEVDGNKVGRIKGGATLEYKPTEYEVSDDTGEVLKRFVTSEETTFTTGILTWNLDTLSKLVATCDYEDDAIGTRTIKLGGKGARQMAEFIVHFVHTDADGYKVRITLVGTSSAGFSLAFAQDKETVIDAEFKAKAQDAEGTLVKIEEAYFYQAPVTP